MPLSLLQVIHTMDRQSGGVVEGVVQLSLALIAQGHRVEILSLDAPEATDAVAVEGGPGQTIPVHRVGSGRAGYGYGSGVVPWLQAHAADYDLVIVNGLWQYHGRAVHRVLSRLGRPYVVYPHGMLDPWFKRTYPLKHLKKRLYWHWCEYRVIRDAAAVLFTSAEECRLARESFRRYHAREVEAGFGTAAPPDLPDQQRADFLAAFPGVSATRNLLFLGRIQAKKGCDLVLRAFAAARPGGDWRLIMAGPDQEAWRGTLEALAGELGIGHQVVWTGMLQGSRKWGALRCAEVFILPSHQENFGVAVVEALACGVPVLISNKVNIWQEVAAAGAGLVGDDDEAGALSLVSRWLAMDASQRQTMAQAAGGLFINRFTVDASARAFVAIASGLRSSPAGFRTSASGPAPGRP